MIQAIHTWIRHVSHRHYFPQEYSKRPDVSFRREDSILELKDGQQDVQEKHEETKMKSMDTEKGLE